jgi:hypothetical protein
MAGTALRVLRTMDAGLLYHTRIFACNKARGVERKMKSSPYQSRCPGIWLAISLFWAALGQIASSRADLVFVENPGFENVAGSVVFHEFTFGILSTQRSQRPIWKLTSITSA